MSGTTTKPIEMCEKAKMTLIGCAYRSMGLHRRCSQDGGAIITHNPGRKQIIVCAACGVILRDEEVEYRNFGEIYIPESGVSTVVHGPAGHRVGVTFFPGGRVEVDVKPPAPEKDQPL